MSTKLTTKIILQRLQARNAAMSSDKAVHLCPDDQAYVSQTTPMQFKCANNHTWHSTTERVIGAKRGCPKCKIMQNAITNRAPFISLESEAKAIHDNKYTYDENSYINKMSKMTIMCPIHGNFQLSMHKHIKLKTGCPTCNREVDRQQRCTNFICEASVSHDNRYNYDNVAYINSYTPVSMTCSVHGEFMQRPGDHLNKHGCPNCVSSQISNKQITWLDSVATSEDITIQHALNVGEFRIPHTRYKADGYCMATNTIYEFHGDAFHGNLQRYAPDFHCHPFKHHLTAKELFDNTRKKEQLLIQLGYNLVVMWESDFDKLDIPVVRHDSEDIVHSNHIEPTKEINSIGLALIDDKFRGYKHKHNYRCNMCGNEFVSTLTQRKQTFTKRGIIGCPKCNRKSSTSVVTKKLLTELRKDDSSITNNTNTIYIGKWAIKIIDIKKPNNRADMITVTDNTINIFSDEIVDNFELVLKKLQHYMKGNVSTRIHGRQCNIKHITRNEKKVFLDAYHIQGNDRASVQYGAFNAGELLAVMTFTAPRVSVGQKGDRDKYNRTWELSRFATNDQYRIPGIASKLLNCFEREHLPIKVVSYADRRWSEGNMYYKIGFDLERVNPPSYHYVIDGKRKHRWGYRKDILKTLLPEYDSKLTEYANMEMAGYWRVWDCGTLRFGKVYNEHK